ncbi:MAG: isoprenylcysteine carboxylmethyltransferase family protein [Acidobacteriota bacterium]
MGAPEDRAAVRIPPPLVFVAVAGLGVLLGRVLPLPGRFPFAGWLCLAGGIVLLAASLTSLLRSGQDPEPWKPSPSLVARGIYRWSRNPMYVGMALLQAAGGLIKGYGWLVVLVPLSLGLVYRTAVRHEEAYLERKFGDAYRDYCARVRRWL